jgi:hypothetical protein
MLFKVYARMAEGKSAAAPDGDTGILRAGETHTQ